MAAAFWIENGLLGLMALGLIAVWLLEPQDVLDFGRVLVALLWWPVWFSVQTVRLVKRQRQYRAPHRSDHV